MGMTDAEAVTAAAMWLASDPERAGRAVVPDLKTRFGITAIEAIEAIRMAQRLRRARTA